MDGNERLIDGRLVMAHDSTGRLEVRITERTCPDSMSDTRRSARANGLSGRGEVYTYTVVHRAIAAGQPLPTVIAVITLEDSGGLRMISNLVDSDQDDVDIGAPVELVWEDMGPDLAIPRFRLVGS